MAKRIESLPFDPEFPPDFPHYRLDRPKLRKGIYNIVLAARTEGIIRGKTKWFAEGDADQILTLISDERKRIFDEIEKEFGYFTDDGLAKIIVDDSGYYGREGSIKKWQALKEK